MREAQMKTTTQQLLDVQSMLKAKRGNTETKAVINKHADRVVPSENESSLSIIARLKQQVAHNSQKVNRMAAVFDKLTAEEKALVLIAAGVSPQKCNQDYMAFQSDERKRICEGLKMLDRITKKFTASMGEIKFLDNAH